NFQCVEVKKEKDPRRAFVDRKNKAPVLDLVSSIRPLIRVLVAEVDRIGVDPVPIDEKPGDPSGSDLCLITHEDSIAQHFAASDTGIDERPILAMEMSVRKVADIVDDHRVMRAPCKVDWNAGPACFSFEFRYLRNLSFRCARRVPGKYPDQA